MTRKPKATQTVAARLADAHPPARMTADALTRARKRLGLSAAGLGRILQLEGRDPGQTVRRWETGESAVPGPVAVAMRFLLAERAAYLAALKDPAPPNTAIAPQASAPEPLAPVAAIPEPAPAPEPLAPVPVTERIDRWRSPEKTRRRS